MSQRLRVEKPGVIVPWGSGVAYQCAALAQGHLMTGEDLKKGGGQVACISK